MALLIPGCNPNSGAHVPDDALTDVIRDCLVPTCARHETASVYMSVPLEDGEVASDTFRIVTNIPSHGHDVMQDAVITAEKVAEGPGE